MPIRRPDHGCHGYSSSRNSVPWAFSRLIVQRGATSQRDRQQSPDRADRSVSGMRPALTGTGWKRAIRPVQGWGAVQLAWKEASSLVQVLGAVQRLVLMIKKWTDK